MSAVQSVPTIATRPTFTRASTDHSNKCESEVESPSSHNVRVPAAHETNSDQLSGVTKIEAFYLVFGRGYLFWTFWLSFAIFIIALTLGSNTTYTYEPFETAAYGKHSLLGAVATASTIVSAVGQPFAARFADLTGRAWAYTAGMILYAVGFALIAGSHNVNTVIAGRLLNSLGTTFLNTTNSILVADLTPLQTRGFVTSLLAMPYVWTVFIAGDITDHFGLDGWRWGVGMFAIIVPAALGPAIWLLFWAEIKAKKIGVLVNPTSAEGPEFEEEKTMTLLQRTLYYWSRMDGFGLILLGFSWSLILIPFTLSNGAKGGWKNPSMIAMEVVGWVLFGLFILWEWRGSMHPLCPRRVFNRTFNCCLVIDVTYMIGGMMALTFWSSWLYVVKDFNTSEYTYMTLTLTIALCVFGVLAGIVQRVTHNYKYPQLFGLGIRAIGMGITYWAVESHASTGALVATQILIGAGGGFSVVGSQVASQASVPHADLSTVVALLPLFSSLGSSAGSAISTSIWNSKLPQSLTRHLVDTGLATAEEVIEIFGSISVARALPEPVLSQARLAYNEVVKNYLFLPALILALVPIGAGLLTNNYFLGKQHNAIEVKQVGSRRKGNACANETA